MFMLVTYDVSTTTPAGVRRLRQVAKCCCDYGQRVQNSVFEISAEPATWVECRARLLELIDPEEDSLRFYRIGKNPSAKIEHRGQRRDFDLSEPLIV